MKGIYIAGPMTGIPEHNFPAFFAAEKYLRSMGYDIVGNPAEWEKARKDALIPSGVDSPGIRSILNSDLIWLCENANAIFMLSGWEESRGARTEHALAVALGIDIFYQKAL